MAEMDVSVDEVFETLRHPEVHYVSDRGIQDGDRDDRLMFIRGRLAVVTCGKRVVTVLWHTGTPDEWTRSAQAG